MIYNSLETLTGGYIYDRFLVDYLRNQGHRVEVLSLPSQGYVSDMRSNFSHALWDCLLTTPFDILIQDALIQPSMFLLNQKIQDHIQYPLVGLIHSLRSLMMQHSVLQPLYQFVERRYLATLDGYIFNSCHSRINVEKLIDGKKPSVVALPAADHIDALPDRASIRSRASQAETLRILFLGNLLPGKGLHHLLRALTLVDSLNYSIEIIGSPKMDAGYARRIHRQIRLDNLEDRVKLLGVLTGPALSDRLQHSHVLAVPSESESFGMAYLEGFAFGLPALASAKGGAAEIIRQGQNGFLISPGDVDTIAACLRTLNLDRNLLIKMSLAARETYDSHPRWRETLEAIHQYLRTITNR